MDDYGIKAPGAMHSRRYTAFISYRHADNTQEGRRWAEWLHRALERYVVPPDLIGTPNLRGEPIRDSLYPIFRDEDELPANADLATGIRAALEVSDHLIVLCSPRSAVSPWVRKEVREFKELGRSDRILAIIIAGEPNADDPAKAREGILRDEECFCEELRFGAVRDDGTLDWTIRTEPLASDLRPNGTRAEGFVTAEAYREHLTLNSSLTPEKIATRTEAYRQQLDHALIKVIAGLLGVPLGQLIDRDVAHRAELARTELERSQAEAARLRIFSRRLAIAGAAAIVLALLAGCFWWQAKEGRAATQAALVESNRQLEHSQVEEGRAWLERGRAALNKGDHLSALMLAGRAIGYQGYGRRDLEAQTFCDAFPLLLARPMNDPTAEKEREAEASDVSQFLGSVRPTRLPLWAGAMSEMVNCVAFSPDGTCLASGSDDKTIKLWDIISGKELATLQGHTKSVYSVAFSPDGKRMASGSYDNTIKLWDTASSKELATLRGHEDIVTTVAFSPDCTRLASGSGDGTIKFWDTTSGKEITSLKGHTDTVWSVAFSPDGTRLASGSSDNTIKLWDTASSKELETPLHGHESGVLSVAFSPDGTRLASGSDDLSIKLWDTASSKELATLRGHEQIVMSVAISHDGARIASGSGDGTIKFWDTTSGKELGSLQGHEEISSLAFSPDDSRLASASWNKTIKLWDVASGKELVSLQGHTSYLIIVAFSHDGTRLASASWDKTVRLWDTSTGKELATLQGHSSYVRTIAFSPDDTRLASGSDDNTIKLWDTASGKELSSLQGHTKSVYRVAFSPDGMRLASGSDDNTIKLWDVASRKEIAYNKPEEKATANQWLAVAYHRRISDKHLIAEGDGYVVFIVPNPQSLLDLTAPFRAGLLALRAREVQIPKIKQTTPMLHARQDTLAKLADPKLTPERRAKLRMELCTKSSQFRAATALWQRLLQGEWPGFEGATVPKGQAPATIPADSPIRRLYLLALIDATKHPQIHGHPPICQTAAQITPVLTKEMMSTPTISLAMMSLMQILAKDPGPDMTAPRTALLKRLEDVATKEWLAVLQESAPSNQ